MKQTLPKCEDGCNGKGWHITQARKASQRHGRAEGRNGTARCEEIMEKRLEHVERATTLRDVVQSGAGRTVGVCEAGVKERQKIGRKGTAVVLEVLSTSVSCLHGHVCKVCG